MTVTIESLNEYQSLANRTNNYADTHPSNPRHRERKLVATIGLIGEAVEVLELITNATTPYPPVNLKKELGDVCWYIAATLLSYGVYMDELKQYEDLVAQPSSTLQSWASELVVRAKDVSEQVKKEIGHDHHPDPRMLLANMDMVWLAVNALIRKADLDLYDVLATNIEKLASRYPGGFDAMRSMNRVAGDV